MRDVQPFLARFEQLHRDYDEKFKRLVEEQIEDWTARNRGSEKKPPTGQVFEELLSAWRRAEEDLAGYAGGGVVEQLRFEEAVWRAKWATARYGDQSA